MLKLEMPNRHNQLLTIPCLYCKITFSKTTSRKFLTHVRTYHSAIKNDFMCGLCKKGMPISELSRHFSLHSRKLLAGPRTSGSSSEVEGTAAIQQPSQDMGQIVSLENLESNIVEYETYDADYELTNLQQNTPDVNNLMAASVSSHRNVAYRYLLTLYGKGNTTRKQIQETVDCTSALMQTSGTIIESALNDFIKTLPTDALQQDSTQQAFATLTKSILNLSEPFHRLMSESQRLDAFRKDGLIMPAAYHVGYRNEKQNNGQYKVVSSMAQYVSIIDTLRCMMFATNSAVAAVEPVTPHPSPPELITGFQDGDIYCHSQYFRDHPAALRLILYHDDIEVANPLGSKAGVHKLTMFYFALDDGSKKSTLQSIHLAIVAYASDIKEYGYAGVLKPLIADLIELDKGVSILHNGENVVLRARLVQLLGDNLAANQILGLVQSFKADHYCRFCMMSAVNSRSAVELGTTALRNKEAHIIHLNQLADDSNSVKQHGVKASCALDELSYFTGVECSVPDCMHDILEGVGKKELSLLLNSLVSKRLITLQEFNRRLVSLTYARNEYSDKPSAQLNLDTIKQTASQAWCLLRYLPFIVGDVVPVEDEQWQAYLSLRGVMDLVFSPRITRQATYACESAISEHHTLFLEAYPGQNLSPKHHFMLHYGRFMRTHGPLCSYWCMRFEGKHRLAKVIATISCNFKNMPLTVAERYQMHNFAQSQLLQDNGESGNLRKGDVICLGQDQADDEPNFGEITSIIPDVGRVEASLLNTTFDVHMHAYQVLGKLDTVKCRISREMQSLSVVRCQKGNKYICLRHVMV